MSAASSSSHFLHDVGGLFRLQILQNTGLHLGIFHFREGIGGHFAVDGFEDGAAFGRSQILHDIGEVGGMHIFQLFVGDVEGAAAAAGRVPPRWQMPSGWNSAGMMRRCSRRINGREQHSLEQPPENATDPDVHLDHRQDVALAVMMNAHGDVGDAHHFPAGDVDNLLIEQVAADPQHVFVVVIGQ